MELHSAARRNRRHRRRADEPVHVCGAAGDLRGRVVHVLVRVLRTDGEPERPLRERGRRAGQRALRSGVPGDAERYVVVVARRRPRAAHESQAGRRDLLGDVYLYRDAAFPQRPGADRYKIGTITPTRPLEVVIREFLDKGQRILPMVNDTWLMDAFDHVVTNLIWQAGADERVGCRSALDRCGGARSIRAAAPRVLRRLPSTTGRDCSALESAGIHRVPGLQAGQHLRRDLLHS